MQKTYVDKIKTNLDPLNETKTKLKGIRQICLKHNFQNASQQ